MLIAVISWAGLMFPSSELGCCCACGEGSPGASAIRGRVPSDATDSAELAESGEGEVPPQLKTFPEESMMQSKLKSGTNTSVSPILARRKVCVQ